MFLTAIASFVLGVVVYVPLSFLYAFLMEMTWNYTLPDLFGVSKITFWQAFALNWLLALLFGRFVIQSK